jgi:hypothetical protein
MALIAGQVPTSGYRTPDYSGAAQAAGAVGAMPAQMVSGFAGQVQDYMKQQKEQVKSVDTASRIAGLLSSKAPDLIPGIGELKNVLDDQEIPLSERIAAAESLFGMMNTGFEVNKMINQNKLMEMQMQQANAVKSPATKDDDRTQFIIRAKQ